MGSRIASAADLNPVTIAKSPLQTRFQNIAFKWDGVQFTTQPMLDACTVVLM
jgi:hypothetical protein